MSKPRGLIALLPLIVALFATMSGTVGATDEGKVKQLDQEQALTQMIDENGDKLFDDMALLLANKPDGAPFDVIVRLQEPVADRLLQQFTRELGPFSTKYTFSYAYHGFAATLTKGQIQKLQQHPLVASIQHDAPVRRASNTSGQSFGSVKAATDFSLTGDRDGTLTSYSKNDVVVAVIDTGIDGTHIDLDGGKILAFRDFINGRTTAYDDEGHGTHVASTIAGTGEGNSAYRGVAPGAALVGVKVLDQAGNGSMSTIDAAINWVIQHKDVYGIEILNLSLGTALPSNGQDSTSQAINNAAAAGLVPIVAAGNSGPRTYSIGSPAAAEQAITVGAFADVGELGFHIAPFSSRGPTVDGRIKPDLMAPGANITAAGTNTTNGYVTLSGTSMAAPYTAGVAALMLDAAPPLTPAQVKHLLATTAEDWGPTGKDIDYGHGRLQAYEAIKQAVLFHATGPAVPTHRFFTGTLSAPGTTQSFSVEVTSTATPFAASLIMPTWTSSTSPDFDLYMYNPSGLLIQKAEGVTRQETIRFTPAATGAHTVQVKSYAGTGPFTLDVSSH